MIPYDPILAKRTAREWAKHLALWLIDRHPSVFRKACHEVFDTYGHSQPDDLFAWPTDGAVTDAEANTWENMLPDDGRIGIQPRRSQRLMVGRDGPIFHPTAMEPCGDPIWYGE